MSLDLNTKGTPLDQSLNAILATELIDNEAWPVLIRLAESLGMHEMAREFSQALAVEEGHLRTIRELLGNKILEVDLASDDLAH